MRDAALRPLRVLVVDDEAPARARLRRLLAQLDREGDTATRGASDLGDVGPVEVAGEAVNGDEAVARIRELAPDLVLLDIHMPGRDGFGVIEAVGPMAMPLVAFATAYDAHAIRAFEVHAIDYLLKPVRVDRLAAVLRRARRLAGPGADDRPSALAGRGGAPGEPPPPPASSPSPLHGDDSLTARLANLLANFERATPEGSAVPGAPLPGGYLQRVMVHHEERALFVPVARIHRVAAERNCVRLYVGSAQYLLRTPIGALESRLDPDQFLRINRGDIVRLDAVKEMHPWSHGDYHVVLADGTRLVWSRRFRARAGERFAP